MPYVTDFAILFGHNEQCYRLSNRAAYLTTLRNVARVIV